MPLGDMTVAQLKAGPDDDVTRLFAHSVPVHPYTLAVAASSYLAWPLVP
jgi:hypothetical protein